MSQDLFIGIDSGTQGVKVLCLDAASGKVLAEASAPHEIIEDNQGAREQDPAWWVAALEKSLSNVLKAPGVDPGRVRALGVSGQQHGMVPLDAEGNVLRPAKLWCDTVTAPQCDEITKTLGGHEKVVELIGNGIAAGFTASKVLWLAQNHPDLYKGLAAILLPHDYLNYWLTGEMKTECGDASGTAYFEVKSRSWSGQVLRALDPSGKLESCLPELIESDEPVGTLRPVIAERFGMSPNVLVSSGGGDNMMAAIGAGNVVPGVVTASLGTSGTIFAYADKPVIDPAGELAAFCSSTGGWLPLVCTMNVTVATELTRELLGRDLEDFNRLAGEAPTGAEGVLLLPYFNGERTPALPFATATLAGLTAANYSPANLSRAAMEGATFGLKYGLDVMIRLGVDPTEIRLVGGGSKSGLWRQLVADVFNCPVVCPASPEAGALGAAIQAVWCAAKADGEPRDIKELADQYVQVDESTRLEPDADAAAKYQDIYQNYLKLDQAMRGTY